MIGKKFNYGWVIVGYGVLCMLLLHYGTVGSQAIFLLPVTQDLGVSTTTLTMASTYGTIVSMIVTPWAGKLMDKKSIRRLLMSADLNFLIIAEKFSCCFNGFLRETRSPH